MQLVVPVQDPVHCARSAVINLLVEEGDVDSRRREVDEALAARRAPPAPRRRSAPAMAAGASGQPGLGSDADTGWKRNGDCRARGPDA